MNKYVLREKPLLQFILKEKEFEITDDSNPKNSGKHYYEETDKFNFIEPKVNWVITILSIFIDFVSGGGNGGKFKSKPYLEINIKSKRLKIYLIDANISNIEDLQEQFKIKLTNNTNK